MEMPNQNGVLDILNHMAGQWLHMAKHVELWSN